MKTFSTPNFVVLIIMPLMGFGIGSFAFIAANKTGKPTTTIASWYDSDKIECASRDYPVRTVLRVTNLNADTLAGNHPEILVPVTSSGPSLTQYANGRHLDLSKAAFRELADPAVGLIEVEVKPE